MKGSEIRKKFLDYFAGHYHQVVKSSSLVPKNDPTLLFTNAGMNQFKDCFLGIEKRSYKRACSVQKCVRAGGKHNDLENVGYTARHHTFFEMLGNFSFGDYFKKDAIFYGWDFLTREMGLPKEKLWVTIYKDDDEAFELWQEVAGVKPERIVRLGEKDNFWAMGDEGPCGPCSEIIIDQGEHVGCGSKDCAVGCDCDRFLELWNLVFMQYNRFKDGTLEPLPNPSIDTGMGLERITAVIQGKPSNFETDLLFPYIEKMAKLAGVEYGRDKKIDVHLRVIADHIRAMTFLISDGVFPSNEGRGYVLRRIMRRAIRHAKMLGFDKPVLFNLTEEVVRVMKDAYPELSDTIELVKKVVHNEEERFFETLDSGLKILFEHLEKMKKKGEKVFSGEIAFKLYDTYGFPIDLTQDILREQNIQVDMAEFENFMEKQRETARKHWKGEEEAIDSIYKSLAQEIKVDFVGYDTLVGEGKVIKLIQNGFTVKEMLEGEEGEIITDRTPFYGESGGQVGDVGTIESDNFIFEVTDTKRFSDLIIHRGKVLKGAIKENDKCLLRVKDDLRDNTMSHHTATHLLQSALQKVLGPHVKQAGSLVTPDRLRFDFTHFAQVTKEELNTIEELVNQWIRENRKVHIDYLPYDEAIKKGAMAIFGEKYGDIVRLVEVEGVSKELCGGTHQKYTGNIGVFKIVSEESVASGVRRIEACAGLAGMKFIKERESLIERCSLALKTSPQDLEAKLERMLKREKELERELESLKSRLLKYELQEAIKIKTLSKGIKLVTAEVKVSNAEEMRNVLDSIKNKHIDSIIFILASMEEKNSCLLYVPDNLTDNYDAGKLLQDITKPLGGRGGGKKGLAQGGFPKEVAFEKIVNTLFDMLEQK
ncbi:MAG: alanine--tRNA ligase [Proteobacteria bacterium]|nr:alanine--tRNA ligase [Pseudomonadota bacterium]